LTRSHQLGRLGAGEEGGRLRSLLAVRLAELWRYPVKSMAGERLEKVELEPGGIRGDRALHVVDGDGALLTARTRPRLVTLPAACDDGEVCVEGRPWRSDAVAERIRQVAGDDARLVASDGGHRFDDTALLAATDGAVAWMGVDGRRFRPNLLIEGVSELAERSWPGSSLRIGEALVAVRWICKRCVITTLDPVTAAVDPAVLRRINADLNGLFALNCEVARPGLVAVGDRVELMPGPPPRCAGRAPGKVAVEAAEAARSQAARLGPPRPAAHS